MPSTISIHAISMILANSSLSVLTLNHRLNPSVQTVGNCGTDQIGCSVQHCQAVPCTLSPASARQRLQSRFIRTFAKSGVKNYIIIFYILKLGSEGEATLKIRFENNETRPLRMKLHCAAKTRSQTTRAK